jgi:uncharacterized protein (TIGR02266 family)
MEPTGEEKRQHLRIPFVLKVDYADRTRCADATENLSRGGLFVQTTAPFNIGEQVPLSLSFPGLLQPIELVGRVAWIRRARPEEPGGIGICCDREADRRKLEALVTRATTPEAPRSERPQVTEVSAPAGGFRVLLVEDNPHIVEMYSYVLKKLAAGELKGKVPLQVDFAQDGHQALQRLLEGTYHLVMTDLYMPVMDGFGLVERIRKEEKLKNIPVIVISAGGKDAQEKALAVGVDIYLRKPVKFAEVLETVKHLLRIR